MKVYLLLTQRLFEANIFHVFTFKQHDLPSRGDMSIIVHKQSHTDPRATGGTNTGTSNIL